MAFQAGITVVSPQYLSTFNEEDGKYKCCCGCCHARIGTLIIGVLDFIGVIFGIFVFAILAKALNSQSYDDNYEIERGVTIMRGVVIGFLAIFAFLGVTCICLFISLCTENQYLLIPYMIVQMIQIILSSLLLITMIIIRGSFDRSQYGSYVPNGHMIADNLISTCFSFGVSITIHIWYFVVVRNCYIFFKDKNKFNKDNHGGLNLVPATYPPTQIAVYDPYRAGYDQ